MARTWRDLFILDIPPPPPPDGDEAAPEQRGGFFRRLRENMSKTRQALRADLRARVCQTLDDEMWERREETLIYADVGATTTANIVERLETEAGSGELSTGEELTRRLQELLAESAKTGEDKIDLRHEPTVILITGVNGTGKTTTIGKIAWHLSKELHKSVLLAAGDTFRA